MVGHTLENNRLVFNRIAYITKKNIRTLTCNSVVIIIFMLYLSTISGAPNENIVQKHFNIAFLNVF